MTILARPSEWTRTAADRPERKDSVAHGQHYFAFLSYSHADEGVAKWLHEELEKFRVPLPFVGRLTAHGPVPRRLNPIFRDMRELPASDDLGGEIQEAIAHSRFLIVLCSPAAAMSRWTNAEIETFKRARSEDRILAVVVSGEPFGSDIEGREQEECFPPALRYHYDKRGRRTDRRAEPLAADLRGDADARRIGFLKLVAGMLGLGLDELVQREALRRQRRLAGITAGSLVGMLAAAGLAVTAIQARDAARDQRREAESLVEFMLGDLKDKLEPIGRLDALDSVGSRVLDYYSKQDTSELSERGLEQRSKALRLMGQIAQSRGSLDTALALYRQAYAGTAEAVRRNPDDAQTIYEHSLNIFYIGDIARSRGDQAALESGYRENKRLVDRMAAIEPDNLRWRMEQQSTSINLGLLLYNQRRYDEAARLFEGSIGPTMSLASIDPNNGEYQRSASTSIAWLAQAQWALGQLDAAIANRQRQVSFLNRLVRGGRSDVAFRQQLLVAHRSLGLMFTFRGQFQTAAEELRVAAANGDRLMRIEPENAQWRAMTAAARFDLAKALIANRRFAEAADETRIGCDLAAEVSSRNSGSASRPLQTRCLELQSHLALQSGAFADALALAQRALESARGERDVDPMNDRYSIAAQYRLVGDVHRRMGDYEGANRAWSAAYAQLPRNVAERPMEMAEHAELLRRLGRMAELRPLAARLSALGYRSVI